MRPARAVLASVALAGAVGCGNSGKIFERIDAATPPGSNLRMDVFVVRSLSSCAIGPACASQDPSQCFTLSDAAGPRIAFDPAEVQFVPTDDTRIAGAAQSSCFRLGLDTAELAKIGELTAALRALVLRDTGGEVDLDIRLHDVASVDAQLSRYLGGLLLPPWSMTSAVLPNVSRETDFVHIVTGWADPGTGIFPTMNECAGTGRASASGLGAGYSWIGLSAECIERTAFLSTFMIQLSFAMRDVVQLSDLYDSSYPACGAADPDPGRWFPRMGDCTSDPDAPTCGGASCPDIDAFYSHVLARHWPHGRSFTGNHCDDGRTDFDETGIDTGGACDQIIQ